MGWTLQERILSRRCLYLSEWDAVFECQEITASEYELLPPLYELHGQDYRYSPNVSFWALLHYIGIDPSSRTSFHIYSESVEMYTGRRLSFGSGALNAFSGILSAIEYYSDD